MSYSRIISLVPSLTELIIDLGLKDKLVGRSRFCIHPKDQVKDIPVIGGTKNPNLKKIRALKPDYIIANHEENRKEDVLALQKDFRVNVTKIDTIEEALSEIESIGEDLGCLKGSSDLIKEIHKQLSETQDCDFIDTAYFIWRKPWMIAASDTYIDSVLKTYRLSNIFSDKTRYPEIELSELKKRNPKLILLSSEPYPFKEKHVDELNGLLPESKIQLIDGEWFSWYGSRMKEAFRQLNQWRSGLDK